MTKQPRRPRFDGPRDRTLRAADDDRDAVSEILRREHVNGRLDAIEFQERLDRSLAAKTYADLDALVADLPRPAPRRTSRPVAWRPWPLPFPLLALIVVAAIVATHGHVLWLAFPLVAFFVVRSLAWRSWGRRGGYW